MTCASAWRESALLDPAGGQRWVFYDEAWRVMSHPALLRRMNAAWRLARHYGIANAETRVIFRQESDQLGPTAKALGLTSTEQSMLPTLGLGQALWRIKDHSMLVQSELHP